MTRLHQCNMVVAEPCRHATVIGCICRCSIPVARSCMRGPTTRSDEKAKQGYGIRTVHDVWDESTCMAETQTCAPGRGY